MSIKQSSFYVNYNYYLYMIFNTDYNVMSVLAKNLIKNLNHIYQELYINLEKVSKVQTKYYNKYHMHKSYILSMSLNKYRRYATICTSDHAYNA